MSKEIVPIQRIAQTIFVLRGQKVILGRDLASLYGVSVGALTQAVKRNTNRFPKDFVFQLTVQELRNLKSQFVISSWGGRRALPYAFTEQGVAMLSSVLNSERAVKVSIAIMRAFVKLREHNMSGERTRLACWRWRPRHRELFLSPFVSDFPAQSRRSFPARRRKGHAKRVCSPTRRA